MNRDCAKTWLSTVKGTKSETVTENPYFIYLFAFAISTLGFCRFIFVLIKPGLDRLFDRSNSKFNFAEQHGMA
jgi:hypothetical protein